ncbi:MAG: hypothetical protein A3K18_15595 [Lentisphaerae bacterium RIFOXYA12_64_32]|nr:MAG: hypothetical protein A3K18_15595 [Lentisphaerae bacterium RIFOXYA12_64_32]
MLCSYCCSPSRSDEFICPGCGCSLIVARLVHTSPDGRSSVLPLRPRDYVIGFDGECDYYVPAPEGQAVGAPSVGNAAVCLKHMNGSMFSAVHVPGRTVVVNERGITMDRMLQGGDRLTVGGTSYVFLVEKPKPAVGARGAPVQAPSSPYVQILDSLIDVETAGFFRNVCALAVRFLMEATGADRGIFFRVRLEGEGQDVSLALKPMYSWSVRKRAELKGEETVAISEAVVEALLTYDGKMVIIDGTKQTDPSTGLPQRTWVCVPIVVQKEPHGLDDCLAVICAEHDAPQKPLPPDCERMLTAIAESLAKQVARWQAWLLESDANRRGVAANGNAS